MFNKEEKSKSTPELPASPNAKSLTGEVYLVKDSPKSKADVVKTDSSNDASFIIKTINENPGRPAIFENCTGSTFNQVYRMVGRIKPTWDDVNKVIKYKQ
jgi:hypothetical protein